MRYDMGEGHNTQPRPVAARPMPRASLEGHMVAIQSLFGRCQMPSTTSMNPSELRSAMPTTCVAAAPPAKRLRVKAPRPLPVSSVLGWPSFPRKTSAHTRIHRTWLGHGLAVAAETSARFDQSADTQVPVAVKVYDHNVARPLRVPRKGSIRKAGRAAEHQLRVE